MYPTTAVSRIGLSRTPLCRAWKAPILAVFLIVGMLLCSCGSEPATGQPCTIMLYLCGSNLETQEGLASANIDELLKARIPADANVIIQTGGSKRWHGHGISNKKLQRYEVRDHKLQLVEELDSASMGSASTFCDFLKWGLKNYPAERNMLVLWDHGGKSAEAICFDERYDLDGLDRAELKEALDEVDLPAKFDYVVFDACFMSALEDAALLSDYADYLIASQEVIPSYGLDYAELPRDFATMRDVELGKSICDKYLAKCQNYGKGDMAELSLLDLSGVDDVVNSLSAYCDRLVEVEREAGGTAKIVGAVRLSALYGSTSAANLFDVDVFCDSTQLFDIDAKPDDFADAYDRLVAYRVKGRITDSDGVSLFYPFEYDAKVLASYIKTCPVKGYAKLLKGLFDGVPKQAIVLEDAGSIGKDGEFKVRLAEGSEHYLASVKYEVDTRSARSASGYALMGEGCDVHAVDGRTFTSAFTGKWPMLQGQPLLTEAFQVLPHSVAYSAPVEVNGKRTSFVTVYQYEEEYSDGSYVAGHLWEGYDENDIPSKDYSPILAGDEVATLKASDESGERVTPRKAKAIDADANEDEANRVVDDALPTGTYRYHLVFTDVLGREVVSDGKGPKA